MNNAPETAEMLDFSGEILEKIIEKRYNNE